MLRAYMHGFFVDNRLYRKAAALAEPFAYDTYRQQRIDAKLEAARESRISLVRKLPKVQTDSAPLPPPPSSGIAHCACKLSVHPHGVFLKWIKTPSVDGVFVCINT